MKVSLWAEIRRLYEVEGLKRRAIARRLHCCTKTVAKALTLLRAPPARAGAGRRRKRHRPLSGADRRLGGQVPGPLGSAGS